MGERAHTPGPWKAKRSPGLHDGAHDYAISADGATVLSEAFGRGALGEWLPADANARLIVAAPDMFEALKAALPVLEAVQRQYAQLAKSHGMGGDGPVLEAVRAALIKASPHV